MHPQYTPSLDYLAGYFDGEGCIAMTARPGNRSYRLKVSIKSGCLPALQAMHSRFGGVLCNAKYMTNKPLYEWVLGSLTDCLEFLTAIRPFLIEKQSQADVAIGWLEHRLASPVRGGNPDFDIEFAKRTHETLRTLKRETY